MAEIEVSGRVQQKVGQYSEWLTVWDTFKPLPGEVCVFIVPANTTGNGITQSDSVQHLTKTGDGRLFIKDLPWDNAVASNVDTTSIVLDETGKISHTNIERNNTETNVSPLQGETVTVVDSITTNEKGHVTAVNVKTITIPESVQYWEEF